MGALSLGDECCQLSVKRCQFKRALQSHFSSSHWYKTDKTLQKQKNAHFLSSVTSAFPPDEEGKALQEAWSFKRQPVGQTAVCAAEAGPTHAEFHSCSVMWKKIQISPGDQKKDLPTRSSPQHCRTNTFVPDLSHLQGQWLVMYLLLQCTPRAYFTLGFSTYKQRDSAVEFPSLGSWRCKKLTRDQEQTGQVCKKKTWAHTANTWKALLSQKGLLSC